VSVWRWRRPRYTAKVKGCSPPHCRCYGCGCESMDRPHLASKARQALTRRRREGGRREAEERSNGGLRVCRPSTNPSASVFMWVGVCVRAQAHLFNESTRERGRKRGLGCMCPFFSLLGVRGGGEAEKQKSGGFGSTKIKEEECAEQGQVSEKGEGRRREEDVYCGVCRVIRCCLAIVSHSATATHAHHPSQHISSNRRVDLPSPPPPSLPTRVSCMPCFGPTGRRMQFVMHGTTTI